MTTKQKFLGTRTGWRGTLFCIAALAPGVASGRIVTGLGFLPDAPGGTESYARSVSNNGVVAGYGFIPPANAPTTGFRAFRWTAAGGMNNLGTLPGGTYSAGRDVNADGSVVVGWSGTPSNTHAFRSTGAVLTDLGVLPGYSYSQAFGVADNGSVVVGHNGTNTTFFRAFRWNSGVMTDLGTLAGHVSSSAAGVSGNGAVVVGSAQKSQANTNVAFRWTANKMTSLGTLKGGATSEATDANFNGSVVVGTSDSPSGLRAFRWTGNKMTSLGTLAGQPNSYGQAVSGDGATVVGYASDGSTDVLASGSIVSTGRAFLWTQSLGMVDLNNYFNVSGSGWELREARGISGDGSTIVGWGLHNGDPEAWIASLSMPRSIPEPVTGSILALFAGASLVRRRCRTFE